MTLLITILAAVTCTLLWHKNSAAREMNIKLLCLIYWGASLMWLVDTVIGIWESGIGYFRMNVSQLISESTLGLLAVILGVGIWLICSRKNIQNRREKHEKI